jgi:hypothetical protein
MLVSSAFRVVYSPTLQMKTIYFSKASDCRIPHPWKSGLWESQAQGTALCPNEHWEIVFFKAIDINSLTLERLYVWRIDAGPRQHILFFVAGLAGPMPIFFSLTPVITDWLESSTNSFLQIKFRLIRVIYTNPVSTSQETHYFSAARSIQEGEKAVYCQNHTKHTNAFCEQSSKF